MNTFLVVRWDGDSGKQTDTWIEARTIAEDYAAKIMHEEDRHTVSWIYNLNPAGKPCGEGTPVRSIHLVLPRNPKFKKENHHVKNN